MSPTKDRQRAAARARLEREMAARAQAARRRRQLQIGIGSGAAVLLVILGTVWLVTRGGDDKGQAAAQPSNSAEALSCAWNPMVDPSASPVPSLPAGTTDVGTPPTDPPRSGTKTLTISTNQGDITAKVDLAKVPCTGASMALLAEKHFFDDTKCHRLVTEGLKVLQCGDPGAKGAGYRETDGQGGPSYRFAEENLPTDQRPAYPEGVIAMAKGQEPGTTGSQFFIVYGDSQLDPSYTVLGTITKGLDVVKKIGEAGHDDAFAPNPGGGHPKTEVIIKTLTMS